MWAFLLRLELQAFWQASAFLSDVTVFRLDVTAVGHLARNLHLGGIRRNACTESRRLITRRSQVQILPPLLEKALETRPSPFRAPDTAHALQALQES
jgi:hypothetical protein